VTAADIARTKVGAWEDLSPEIRADIRQAAIQQLTRRLDMLERAAENFASAGVNIEDIADLCGRRERLQRAIAAAERLP
jgi:hypothetical protein